jgi:hypothetical protein
MITDEFNLYYYTFIALQISSKMIQVPKVKKYAARNETKYSTYSNVLITL